MPTVTCNACNVGFDDEEQQRLHYHSLWHRYNLKRKTFLNFGLFVRFEWMVQPEITCFYHAMLSTKVELSSLYHATQFFKCFQDSWKMVFDMAKDYCSACIDQHA